jgi:hypothetical protein
MDTVTTLLSSFILFISRRSQPHGPGCLDCRAAALACADLGAINQFVPSKSELIQVQPM